MEYRPKVALAMIVKASDDEVDHLENCLSSVKDHVDKIFIDLNTPKNKKIPNKLLNRVKSLVGENGVVTETVWAGNFVAARNENFARVPQEYKWIIWLDTDDTVTNPEKIKEVCAVADVNADGIYIKYEYSHDTYGNITSELSTARVVKNNGSFAWKSSFADGEITVHETLNEVRRVNKVQNNEFWVVHHSDEERRDASLRRNIELLEGMLEKTKESPDPRILYYLATHYVDAGLLARARTLFERYLTMSGWAEERAEAWSYLGDIYKGIGQKGTARGCYMKAIAEDPKSPISYIELADLEMQDKLWDKAIEWLEMARSKKPNITAAVQRPLEVAYRGSKMLAECYTNKGPKHYKDASKCLERALKLRPYEPELHQARELLDELTKTADLNEALLKIIQELKENRQTNKIVELLNYVPKSMQDSPLVHSIRNYYRPIEAWPERSIAIVCGGSAVGTWGPWSINDGVGGSEEAVIQLSILLAKKGWKVTVYAIPGDRAGEYDGVQWRHYWEFSSKDKFDVVIGWRDPAMFDKKLNARKTYLWLHDVVEPTELFKERIDNLTKVIFVGQYHRDIYPFLSDDKCFVSGNGIDPLQFDDIDGRYERDLHRCVYMSAHERGVELLYKIWPDVRKEVPDAKLDVYYGWKGFDEINKDNPERMAWKDKIQQLEKELAPLGVTNHGKISHFQIAEEIAKSGIWAYPTLFPEVYCITGVKAQAGGAWPVTSDYAALSETVEFGDQHPVKKFDKRTRTGQWAEKDLEQYKQLLINRLKNPPTENERFEMMKWARYNMSWDTTAENWSKEFEA